MKTIGVFFGGQSAEHDISIVTAISSVIKPLQATGEYRVVPVYISKDGSWYSNERLNDIALYQTEAIDTFLKKTPSLSIRFDNGLVLEKPKRIAGRKQPIRIDIGFPAMHGTHGENGELMAIFEMANIPYVGCELLPSAIAMDKVVCKTMVEAHGIPTPKMYTLKKHEYSEINAAQVINTVSKTLHMPLFVKPARLGSSIGITKVEKTSELEQAIEVAFHYDTKILVEEAVPNLIEVTVPIIGNEDPRPSLVEQPILSQEESFDFEAKYLKQNNQGKGAGKMADAKSGAQGYSNLPAKISKKLYVSCIDTALAAYKALECTGIARVDLLIDEETQTVYFNELNPLPGSLYRHNWHASGVSAIELVSELIDFAEKRFAEKNGVHTAFKTNFLKQF